jgi:hypothetical protein
LTHRDRPCSQRRPPAAQASLAAPGVLRCPWPASPAPRLQLAPLAGARSERSRAIRSGQCRLTPTGENLFRGVNLEVSTQMSRAKQGFDDYLILPHSLSHTYARTHTLSLRRSLALHLSLLPSVPPSLSTYHYLSLTLCPYIPHHSLSLFLSRWAAQRMPGQARGLLMASYGIFARSATGTRARCSPERQASFNALWDTAKPLRGRVRSHRGPRA